MFTHPSTFLKSLLVLTAGVPFLLAANAPVMAETNQVSFQRFPNKPFLACMAASPNVTPTVDTMQSYHRL